ncbi:VTC domain-containing protein [Paraflavisolibacter sp. H34]|uniref:VTC domain-containing protein n=1 Tax=Huijunlia imazamoxiresistens TaxID=3127457 RepID=UPI00301879A8
MYPDRILGPTAAANDLAAALFQLEDISLQGLNRQAALLNRVDTKYLLPLPSLPPLLADCRDHYRVLQVGDHRLCRYETHYYDTPDLHYYHAHHAGHGCRLKVRRRRYVESDLHFLEVKHRTNKGRTDKPRIPLEGGEADPLGGLLHPAFSEVRPFFRPGMQEVVRIDYSRITLARKSGAAERITLDLHPLFAAEGTAVSMPSLVIAEVKQDKARTSPFLQLMKERRLRPGSLSKYCLGVATLFDEVKKNQFKSLITQLKKKTGYHVYTSGY